ncbi:hypothetical protein Mal15_20240 [Stieleria maiorica]|uniref:Uncharacterized protein n=1 Tax=Stieleria maiorica TaxID=2795974 RepID=A0A5B9MA36_9BACT|nr:hypothetical protein Mal15_20240 [Stieleria maiorica]
MKTDEDKSPPGLRLVGSTLIVDHIERTFAGESVGIDLH